MFRSGLVAAAVAALAVAGCGGGSKDSKPDPRVSDYNAAVKDVNNSYGKPSTPDLKPASEIKAAIGRYRTYADGRLSTLQAQAGAITAALQAGDRTAAQDAWDGAFGTYLQLGAVYGAFGDLDTAIDGLPGGMAGGTADPHFTGLHRLEFGLWGGQSLSSLVPVAQRLSKDVGRLHGAIATLKMDPLDYTLRAHEILEDAERDFLSGADVQWSDQGVLATAAGVTATREVLKTFGGLIDSDLAAGIDIELTTLEKALAQAKADHGGTYPTLAQLSPPLHQRINAAMGGALEQLQNVPTELEITRAPVFKSIPNTPLKDR